MRGEKGGRGGCVKEEEALWVARQLDNATPRLMLLPQKHLRTGVLGVLGSWGGLREAGRGRTGVSVSTTAIS